MPSAKKPKALTVSLGAKPPQNGQERVTGLDAGQDATLTLQAPPGGPDRGAVAVWKDPGPPPHMPYAPVNAWPFGLSRLIEAAKARDRAALLAFDVMRLPPAVGRYRAELLGWLDSIEAYEKVNGQRP